MRFLTKHAGVNGFCHEAGGDNGNTNIFAQACIVAISPDDLRIVAGLLLNVVCDERNLIHEEFVGPECDVHQNEVGSGNIVVNEQRRLKGNTNRPQCASFAACLSASHDGYAAVFHDGFDIVHVYVHRTGQRDDFRNALGGGAQHFVCMGESLLQREVAVQFPQFIVANDQQGINSVAHVVNTRAGLKTALPSFKHERNGYDTYRQYAHFLGRACYHRCCTRACASAHTGGDKDHIG